MYAGIQKSRLYQRLKKKLLIVIFYSDIGNNYHFVDIHIIISRVNHRGKSFLLTNKALTSRKTGIIATTNIKWYKMCWPVKFTEKILEIIALRVKHNAQ